MVITFKAPCAKLENIENLWLQLSKVACNLKCKHCYLDCHYDTRKRNFLSSEIILKTLKTPLPDLKRIYLTGGEPFLHPKINEIIKYCLTKADVTICTNGTLLSEKKAKILKEIENSSLHKLSFKVSLDHYMIGRNDEYRGQGVFKKVINALKSAQKCNFECFVTCVNLKNELESDIRIGFDTLFKNNGLNIPVSNLKIVPLLKVGSYAKYYNITENIKNVSFDDLENFDINNLDCKNSRVVTVDGVYSCPALVNDPRGKLGETISDASDIVYLETQICYDCVNRKDKLFG